MNTMKMLMTNNTILMTKTRKMMMFSPHLALSSSSSSSAAAPYQLRENRRTRLTCWKFWSECGNLGGDDQTKGGDDQTKGGTSSKTWWQSKPTSRIPSPSKNLLFSPDHEKWKYEEMDHHFDFDFLPSCCVFFVADSRSGHFESHCKRVIGLDRNRYWKYEYP